MIINDEQVCQLYKDGSSLRKISLLFDTSVKSITNILKRNNITRRQSTYSLNQNYFEKIDSPQKAYILGLLFADGSISNRNVILKLQEKDKHILDHINMLLDSDHILYFTPKKKESCQNIYTLSISNVKLRADLIKQGVVPNKTFILRFPNIEKQFIFDFIRGVFDGDGYFHSSKRRPKTGTWAIVGNKTFCEQIKDILGEYNITSQVYQNSSRHAEIAEVRVGQKENIKKIFDLMYNNSDIHLFRKYDKMLEFVSRPEK